MLSQVSSYLNSHNHYNTRHSAYRPGYSTETTYLKVGNDLFLSHIKGNISVLALLDLSSAFDTIYQPILVLRFNTDFGLTDTVLQWFLSYLTDRTHYVSLSNNCPAFSPLHSGVPWCPVLGPMLFNMYTKPLSAVIDSHSITHCNYYNYYYTIIHHLFADDLQLQMSAPPDRIYEILHSMQSCIDDVNAWQTAISLKLNDTRQNSCLSHPKDLSISITYLLHSL